MNQIFKLKILNEQKFRNLPKLIWANSHLWDYGQKRGVFVESLKLIF